MPVVKQTYTATAPWTGADLAGLLRTALIDAGLMTEWHDSFTVGGQQNPVRVLKIEHDATKTYGSSYYYFVFSGATCVVALASGWNAVGTPPVNVPTGTQYLDYHTLPASIFGTSGATELFTGSLTSNISLDRFTSGADNKQSWFVFRQATNRCPPFSILHKNTVLHTWLDLNRGMISGLSMVEAQIPTGSSTLMGFINFQLQENLRRCLLIGPALRGSTSNNSFHGIKYNAFSYFGVGSGNDSYGSNFGGGVAGGSFAAGIPLPIGRNSANPAFVTDYVPICSDLPWSPFTATRLAVDFGVYMHYADNTTSYGDRFIVQSAVNEWEVIQVKNSTVLNDGASASFLARII
jgi:hypothetical protein